MAEAMAIIDEMRAQFLLEYRGHTTMNINTWFLNFEAIFKDHPAIYFPTYCEGYRLRLICEPRPNAV